MCHFNLVQHDGNFSNKSFLLNTEVLFELKMIDAFHLSVPEQFNSDETILSLLYN